MTATAVVDRVAIRDHLNLLYGAAESGWLSVLSFVGETERPIGWFNVGLDGELDRAVDYIAQQSLSANTFISVNLQRNRLPVGRRGGADTVSAVTALVYDVDIGAPNQPATQAEALAFSRSWPIEPSLIIDSGRGKHFYWLLLEPFVIEDADERAETARLSRAWGAYGHRLAKELGYDFDTVSDLARVLRPAGSLHLKDPRDPRPVRILHDAGVRYALSDFEDVLPDDLPLDGDAPPAPEEGTIALTEAQIEQLIPVFRPIWVDRQRHEASKYVSGWLATKGISEASTLAFTQRISTIAGDRDTNAKLKTARDAYRVLRSGRRPEGWQGLKRLLTPEQLAILDKTVRTRGPRVTVNGQSFANGRPADQTEGAGPSADGESAAGEASTRPEIDAGDHNLERTSELAWKALMQANKPPRLFRFGAVPVRIEQPDDDHVPVAQTLDADRLSYELARSATWIKTTEKGGVKDANPPIRLIKDMLAAPAYPFPPLLSIVQAPTFARDGSLHSKPGYNPATRSFYAPPKGLEIPPVSDHPNADDVAQARDLILDELIGQFPFVSLAERANAVSLFFEPSVRTLIEGGTPLRLFEAPTAGCGKGLLADVLLRPSIGRRVNVMPAAIDDDEWRKRITAQLSELPEAIQIDNINKPLDSGSLAAALTTPWWNDRRLGSNDMIRVPVRCLWIATANNPTMSTEVARRTVRIRLDPKVDRPWQRGGFKHEDLRGWVEDNRGRLIWAALTIVRAWFNQGAPKGDKRLGSFEQWSAIMGGILTTAGVDGFLDNLDEFYEVADTEGAIWRQFVAAWAEKFGENEAGVSDLFDIAVNTEGFDFGKGSERAQRTSFGKQLGKQRDRVIGDYRIQHTRTVQRLKRWRLQRTQRPESPNDGVHGVHECTSQPTDHAHTRVKSDYNGANTYTDVHDVHMNGAADPNVEVF